MQLFTLLSLCLVINQIQCFTYTLPGDENWPKTSVFSQLKTVINGKVILKDESDYKPHTWNRITNIPKPAVIIQPTNSNDIIEALKFAKKYNIRTSVQSTGHHQDHRNIYDNSIHIDMSSMNSKSIDLTGKTLTVGPGNNFQQIQSYVASQSGSTLVALCGADPGVGIYGWTTGGGHGALTRIYGLGVDALLSIDLILANFTVITASETQNKELFRAIRGSGGGTYGIAVSLTVRLYADPGRVSTFGGLYELSSGTAEMFANWMISAPNEAGGYFLSYNFDTKYVLVSAYCFSNSTFCLTVLSSLKSGCIPFPEIQVTCDPSLDRFNNFFEFFNSSVSEKGGVVYLASTVLSASNIVAGLKEITTYIDKYSYTGCSGNSILGGKSSTIDLNQDVTSVAVEMRTSVMAITCFSAMDDSTSSEIRKLQVLVMDNLSESIYKKYSKWVYWNEPQHNFPSNDWKERYWGGMANYNRLLAVKNQYDSDNFYSCYHCVGYERILNEDPSVCPVDKCTCSNTPYGDCNKEANSARKIYTKFSVYLSLVYFMLF
jgi:hypothetical protein